jgi:AhpD family alkylhydroperoxidase
MDHPAAYARLNASVGALADAAPGVMAGFASLQQASQAEGALSAKVKELMALAIGIAVHCEGCITYHVHDALGAGASPQEVAETVGVAVMMGGGPAVVYGAEALEALVQFQAVAP